MANVSSSNNDFIEVEDSSSDDMSEPSQISQIPRPKVRVLNELSHKEASKEYGRIFRETKKIDKHKHDYKSMLNQIKTAVKKENSCLSRFGVNESMNMDAKNMALASDLTHELVKKFQVIDKFDLCNYLRALRIRLIKNAIKMKQDEFDPSKRMQLIHLYPTGKLYRHLSYSAPAFSRGYKSDFVPKPVQVREKRVRKLLPSGQATQPEQYDSTKEMNIVDRSDKRLEYIYNKVKKLEKKNNGQMIPFLQASFNPRDFAVTVENIFNMAFLARQSRLLIKDDKDCPEPVIQTRELGDDQEANQDGVQQGQKSRVAPPENTDDSIQSIFSFDMKSYEDLIHNLEIKNDVLK